MEIDVTFLLNVDCGEFSSSVAELGENAGQITWQNALGASGEIVASPEEIQELKDYFKDFGAWDDDERAAWTPEETKALLIQMASGDMRGAESFWNDETNEIDWVAYCDDESSSRSLWFEKETGKLWYSAAH